MARFQSNNAPLPANGTYESGTIYTGRSDYVVGSAYSDQGGTLYIEQSTDDANWDISTSFAVIGGSGQGFSETIYLPYARIRFVNGAAAQGSFRIYARLSSAGPR